MAEVEKNEEVKAPSNFIHDFIDEDLAEGKYTKIQTRFPPEPNGYLHIGHAKAICINFGVKEKYHGICNLRLDDTNPIKEDTEYVDAIKEDIKWLGFDWDNLYYASDYFDFLYECAIKLIKKGKAYVCELSPEQMREYRGTLTEPGKNSPYRDRSIEENLDLFDRMTKGEFEEGKMVLRAKSIWRLLTSICVTLSFTELCMLTTTEQVTNGAYILCTTLLIPFQTLMRV